MKLNLLYSLALICYGLTLYLFVRLLYWKYKSKKYYWGNVVPVTKKDLKLVSSFKGEKIPYISLLIPAKNESAVIRQTIYNALKLDYFTDSYEILVVTDERELIEKEENLKNVWAEIQLWKNYSRSNKLNLNRQLYFQNKTSKLFQQAILLQKAKTFILGSFYNELYIDFSSLLTFNNDSHILLALKQAVENTLKRTPTTKKELTTVLMVSLRKQFPNTSSKILKKIMGRLENTILPWIRNFSVKDVLQITKEDLERVFQTTKSIAEEMKGYANKQGVELKVVVVPTQYTGEYPRTFTTNSTKSTKGRALNYALDCVSQKSSLLGFYDAESRPDSSVLLHVAYSYLEKGEEMNILQGPLYQVRNYYTLGFVSRIGGLFKAVSHEWYLPLIFKKLPFVGGTNLFVRKSLLKDINGFNPTALTEDLDLGVRAYLKNNVGVSFLPVISTEQTPPFWNQFFKQRLRWASGHLEVMSQVRKINRKLFYQLFWKGPFEWLLYQFSGLIVVIMNIGWVLSKIGLISQTAYSVNPILQIVLLCLNVPYIFFSFYCFYHYQFTFDKNFLSLDSIPYLECIKLVLSCLFVFLLPFPYTWAIILKLVGKSPTAWVKTPRTAE
jgi:cellulose synthase/poly-beta-1,6-N-acetylglucosamine synthase-like glycosyltransferase